MNESDNYSKRTVTVNSYVSKVTGVLGVVTAAIFLFVELVLFIVYSIVRIKYMLIPLGICGFFAVAGLYAAVKSSKVKKQVQRFKKYSMIIGDRCRMPLRSIAEYTSQSVEYVEKDLQRMIDKSYIVNAYIDRKSKSLILRNGKVYTDDFEKFEDYKVEEKPHDNLESKSPADSVINTGEGYLREIRKADVDIKSRFISDKILQIENTTNKIFDVIKSEPGKAGQIRKFMDYYLPTTLKLLKSYALLEDQGIDRENISSTMKNIEDAMNTIVVAFENQLDSLFADEAMDISTDITVLETMMAQEGLTGDDMERAKKQ